MARQTILPRTNWVTEITKLNANFTELYTGAGSEGTVLPAATGTIAATMDGTIKRITPTGACTFNATGGIIGQSCAFVITTSGTTTYTLTWGTNFKTTATLATGSVTAKVFVVNFVYDGTKWNEVSRTVAM